MAGEVVVKIFIFVITFGHIRLIMKWFKSNKEKKQFPHMIAVYLSQEYDKILVAPFFC
jgi:hypothetical protein